MKRNKEFWLVGLLALGMLSGCGRLSLTPYEHHFHRDEPPPRPGQVTATFLGVSSVLITDGQTSLMVDGFLTRPSSLRTRSPAAKVMPDRAVIARALARIDAQKLDAVLVSHSHWDHAMDAPEVAAQTGALLLGSESTANIARGWELPESQIRVVRAGERSSFGQFGVTFFETRHVSFVDCSTSPPTPDLITAPIVPPVPPLRYATGETYSILIDHPLGRTLVHGSAGYVEGALRGVRADVVFLGIARLGNQKKSCQDGYFRNLVTEVGARRIIPVHWDDHTTSLDLPLRPARQLIADFRGAMHFLHDETKKDPGLELQLLQGWQKTLLFSPR